MPNRLIYETSPYLLQHAENPVDWYPYGPEAIAEAQRRDCPMIISIGYSACHWCHVMEHESFSEPSVASVMNELFVCVKVDREERPDVDQIYMNAIQLLQGQGGWPLNCFALPDGRPFWGGTYFKKDQWVDILQQLSNLYHTKPDEIVTQADRIHQGIKAMGMVIPPKDDSHHDIKTIKESYEQLALRFDSDNGGTSGAPKFPMPVVWEFVLDYYYITRNRNSINQFELTLQKMANGGIFDQIAGGFARYSTDVLWKVPHFEKMLYDNAQLATLYARAYQVTGDHFYLQTLTKTLEFVKAELTSKEGGFFAALDADSEGEEGLFYLWKKHEILELLPEYGELLSRYWGIDSQGLWENGYNILLKPMGDKAFASREHLSAEELRQLIKMASSVLLTRRNTRVRPSLDNKVILAWNAMMIKSLAISATITGNEQWVTKSIDAANFVINNMITREGIIHRAWKDGKVKINGFLDDYALLADAFIYLYQLTFDESWLLKARQLTLTTLSLFSQENSPLFWFMPENNEDNNIIKLSRVLETTDGVEPSGNAVMAWVLLCLGNYFEEQEWVERSSRMCSFMKKNVVAYPGYYAKWASVTAAHAHGMSLIVITGESSIPMARQLQKQFHPFSLLAAASDKSDMAIFKNKFKKEKTLIYKCVNHTCDAPVSSVEDISF